MIIKKTKYTGKPAFPEFALMFKNFCGFGILILN